MILLFLLFLPMVLGIVGRVMHKSRITWKEFALHEAVLFVVIASGYGIATCSRTDDVEHWNGVVASKTKDSVGCCHPYCCMWGTCRSGKNSYPCCKAYCNLHSYDIEWNAVSSNKENVYSDGCNSPGSSPPERWTAIVVGEPTSVEHSFTNYIKGNPDSILRRQGIAEKWGKMLPDYPKVYDYYRADKFILAAGEHHNHTIKKWNDKLAEMNGRLGSLREVNIIIVLTQAPDREYVEALREHWIGGKKNDLVLVIGSPAFPTIAWTDVMTWSLAEQMRISIRDRVGKLGKFDGDKVLEILEAEVGQKFVRRKWEDFNYLKSTIEPSSTAQIILFIMGMVLSGVLWFVFHQHDVFEEET